MNAHQRAILIRQYGEGPKALLAAWNACPSNIRQWKPTESDWSAAEIIQHCGDSETFAATRIRLLVVDPEPIIVGYDQDAWVHAFEYGALSADDAFEVIDAVRRTTHRLIVRLDERQWEATGRHTQSGPYSALDWLASYGVHLHDHADQIRSNVDAWHIRHGGPR